VLYLRPLGRDEIARGLALREVSHAGGSGGVRGLPTRTPLPGPHGTFAARLQAITLHRPRPWYRRGRCALRGGVAKRREGFTEGVQLGLSSQEQGEHQGRDRQRRVGDDDSGAVALGAIHATRLTHSQGTLESPVQVKRGVVV